MTVQGGPNDTKLTQEDQEGVERKVGAERAPNEDINIVENSGSKEED